MTLKYWNKNITWSWQWCSHPDNSYSMLGLVSFHEYLFQYLKIISCFAESRVTRIVWTGEKNHFKSVFSYQDNIMSQISYIELHKLGERVLKNLLITYWVSFGKKNIYRESCGINMVEIACCEKICCGYCSTNVIQNEARPFSVFNDAIESKVHAVNALSGEKSGRQLRLKMSPFFPSGF